MSADVTVHHINGSDVRLHRDGRTVLVDVRHLRSGHTDDSFEDVPVTLYFEDQAEAVRWLVDASDAVLALTPQPIAECSGSDMPEAQEPVG